MTANLSGFLRWATGNLVDNRNRGIFAEWLVGQALGVIEADDVRTEWDAVDLRFGDLRLEVKASGLSQAWNPLVPSTPPFGVPPQPPEPTSAMAGLKNAGSSFTTGTSTASWPHSSSTPPMTSKALSR